MLKQLRQRKTMKRILWVLAILIIPPFAFWGAGSALRQRQNGPDCAGMLFGKKVSFEKYARVWEETRNQSLLMYGSKLEEMADSLDFNQQAWERLMLLEEAAKRHIKVPDAEVIKTIEGFQFLQSNGKFDKKAYELVIRQAFRTEPRQFEEGLRNSLKIFKLRDETVKDVVVSDEEVKEAYKRENEKSKISYILVPAAEFKDAVSAGPEELKKYYDENAESFRVGDQVNVEYLAFEFTKPEEKEKALEAAEKLDYVLSNPAKSFEEAAKENSLTIKETGFFTKDGVVPQIGWLPEIQKAAFKLNPGERSSLIKPRSSSARGYYIIRVKEKKPSYVPAFEEVKPEIENILKEQRAGELASKEAERLHKEISDAMTADKISLEQAAAKAKKTVKTSEPFARNSYVQGLGMASEFGEAAFTAKPGELAPLASTRGGWCIYHVAEITPVDQQKFEKEKEEFKKKALEAKKSTVLNEWYLDLLKRAGLKSNLPQE